MKVLIDLEYFQYLKHVEETTEELYKSIYEDFMYNHLKNSIDLKLNREVKIIENEEKAKNIM